jgi:hypothetical protein
LGKYYWWRHTRTHLRHGEQVYNSLWEIKTTLIKLKGKIIASNITVGDINVLL